MIRAFLNLVGEIYAASGDKLGDGVVGDELARLEALSHVGEVIAHDIGLAKTIVEFNLEHPPVTIRTQAPPQDAEVVDPLNQAK